VCFAAFGVVMSLIADFRIFVATPAKNDTVVLVVQIRS